MHFFPFNPVDKRTALTYIDSDGNWQRASKGAPEQVILNFPTSLLLSMLFSSNECLHTDLNALQLQRGCQEEGSCCY